MSLAARMTGCFGALIALACGGGGDGSKDVSARAAPTLAGTYQVEGLTTVIASGDSRPIDGTVILAQEGDAYSATFHLNTSFPSPDGNVDAQVIGKGEGTVSSGEMVGTAETQILTAMFAGVDAQFPFLPQMYGPRVVSSSVGKIKPDGSIQLEIETKAAEGQQYAATKTTMTGVRARPRGVEGFPEPRAGAGVGAENPDS